MIYKNQCRPPLSFSCMIAQQYWAFPYQLGSPSSTHLYFLGMIFFLMHNPHLYFHFSHALFKIHASVWPDVGAQICTLLYLSDSCPHLIPRRFGFFHLQCKIMYTLGHACDVFGSASKCYQIAPTSLYFRKRHHYKHLQQRWLLQGLQNW